MEIKIATLADIQLIRELTMQVWPQTYTPIIGPGQVAYMLGLFYTPEALQRQIAELNHRFIICSYNGQPVAFASYSETEEGIFKLHKIYILSGMQGKGIGSFMIGYIVHDIITQGATALRLNVNRYNALAIAFYEKTGFTHFADEDINIGNGYFMNDHVLNLSV